MTNKSFYIPISSNQSSAKASSKRPPLTPSSVSPPSLNTHHCATRSDTGVHAPAKAAAILTRMASHSSRRSNPSSPPQSPVEERQSIHSDSSSDYWCHSRQGSSLPETQPYVRISANRFSGGYISFPDFEKYSHASDNDQDDHS
ncbi:uncharacterized protein IWZ02DRAFT_272331 [Phyllosticta citriasiana]|uniref:DUF4005 domain-containing protein n=1 Tax=Phyllosticta citriasiana TaxID=595635 RepID=A0ABR1L0U5_9PEZI